MHALSSGTPDFGCQPEFACQPDFACQRGRLLLRRRSALLGLGAAVVLGRTSLALASTPGNARLVVINLRGGMDGLAAVAPYGDHNLAGLRAPLMSGPVGAAGGMLYLGGFFGLHPALANLHAMFQSGEALMVHAVGNSAFTRSHFEGQDYIQGGAPEALTSGWLNRVVGMIPAPPGSLQTGISVNVTTPLLIRGAATVAGWAHDPFPMTSPTLAASIVALNQSDPVLGPAMQVGNADRNALKLAMLAGPKAPAGTSSLAQMGWATGEILASPTGPRVAAIETDSFDTHADQLNRLNAALADLDATFLALKTTLGAAWANTVVLTMTEFGRTAYANNTTGGGTDHGTGFAVILAGGAVAGGKVVTTWPGLGQGQLYQQRDLQPTLDYRAIAMGVLQGHLGIPASAMPTIFPGASGISALGGLVRG